MVSNRVVITANVPGTKKPADNCDKQCICLCTFRLIYKSCIISLWLCRVFVDWSTVFMSALSDGKVTVAWSAV